MVLLKLCMHVHEQPFRGSQLEVFCMSRRLSWATPSSYCWRSTEHRTTCQCVCFPILQQMLRNTAPQQNRIFRCASHGVLEQQFATSTAPKHWQP